MICPACGSSNPKSANYCNHCGRALSSSEPDGTGEHRPVTVLMCDLVNSTALGESLDPEDSRALMNAYRDACAEVVARHEGFIARYIGDGILIYFGFPRAHEDDPHRAMRCGLELLASVTTLSVAKLRSAGEFSGTKLQALASNFQVRLGVHSDRTIVGVVGTDANREYVAERVINIAQRVQSEAEPNSLVATDASWQLVQPFFNGEPLGERLLRGVGEPMRLWRVVGGSGAQTRLEGTRALTPYVGRDREHASLELQWSAAKQGQARFVLVRGVAGIGKSRLVQEFRRHVATQEADLLVDFLEMRCTDYTKESAFVPVIELIAARLGFDRSMSPEARLDRIDARLSELGVPFPDAAPLLAELMSIPIAGRYPPLALSPNRRRTRTLDVLIALLHALASRQPTILIAEDLHWADPASLELLELLVSSASRLRFLVVLTARPEFQPGWFAGAATAIIEIPPLDVAAIVEVATCTAHGKQLPSEVSEAIVGRSEGIPLYVEELTRTVIELGVLDERESAWELSDPLPVDLIPESLEGTLTARIDRLGETKVTLQIAATIGREVPYSLIKAVSERPDASLRADMQRMVESSLLSIVWSGLNEVYVFNHAMIFDAAYKSLGRGTRQRFHDRVARALLDRFPEISREQPELIAHHLTGAGKHEEALSYWEAASQRAVARTSMTDAAAYLGRALETVSRLPQEPKWLNRELALQSLVAPVAMTVHGWGSQQVRVASERALALATQLGRHDMLYPSTWFLWTNQFVRGELDNALVVARSARAMADAAGIPMLQMSSHHALSYTHLYRGELEETLREARAGLSFYNLEQERVLAATFQLSSAVCLHATSAKSLWMLGRPDEAEEERKQMLRFARELNHVPSLAAALSFDLYIGLSGGWSDAEIQDRIAVSDELLKLTSDEGFSLWNAQAMVFRGAAAAGEGDAARASSQMEQGVAECIRTGARVTLVGILVMCAEAWLRLGEGNKALKSLDNAQVEANSRGEWLWEPEIGRVRASVLLLRDDAAGAERELRRARDRAQKQGARSLEWRAAEDLSGLLARTGRKDEANAIAAASRAPTIAPDAPERPALISM